MDARLSIFVNINVLCCNDNVMVLDHSSLKISVITFTIVVYD
jgi:hypothetical protein